MRLTSRRRTASSSSSGLHQNSLEEYNSCYKQNHKADTVLLLATLDDGMMS
jgi:hypothetical protein